MTAPSRDGSGSQAFDDFTVASRRGVWVAVACVVAVVGVAIATALFWSGPPTSNTQGVAASGVGVGEQETAGPEASLYPFDPLPAGFELRYEGANDLDGSGRLLMNTYASIEVYPVNTPVGEGRYDLHVAALLESGLPPAAGEELREKLVAFGTPAEGISDIEVNGRAGFLTREDLGGGRASARAVLFTNGAWLVQVTTTAPSDYVSDEDLVRLAERVDVR